tara:strand:- start:141 stop:545 length:405 start_codon:yes stop_codon:yes gene_type:complete
MKFFLVITLLVLTSCVSNKFPHNYFVDCEKKFTNFTNLSSCAIKDIQKDCEDISNCANEKSRFVDIMKRLQIMVNDKEISENEAMFRYLNLIDSEESRFNARKNFYPSPYQHYSNDFYLRGIPACYFSRTSFCY